MQQPKLPKVFIENPILLIGTGVFLFMVIVAIIIAIFSHPPQSPSGGEYVAPDSGAFLSYDKKSYFPANTVPANTALEANVAYYARQVFSVYNPATQPAVSFYVTKKPVNTDTTTTFTGHFEKVNDSITVSFTKLNNDQLKISIVDNTTHSNIDSGLPANSKSNQFIGSMPLKYPNFTIDYNAISKSYIVYSDVELSKAQGLQAKTIITTGIGVADLTDADITFSVYRSKSEHLSDLK